MDQPHFCYVIHPLLINSVVILDIFWQFCNFIYFDCSLCHNTAHGPGWRQKEARSQCFLDL